MRHTFLALAVAVAALSMLPAAAGADSKSDQIRAYWTPERMRSATPLGVHQRAGQPKERARPGGGGGGTTTWSTLAVSWPGGSSQIYAHGKLFFNIGASRYVCSGTAVADSVVWTAGHCVNQGPGTFYTNFLFIPAYNSDKGAQPYGSFAATNTDAHTTTQWKGTSPTAYGYDLGAIHVGTNEAALGSKTLGGALGTGNLRSLDTSYTSSAANDSATTALHARVLSYGYPAEGKYTGTTEYVCDTYIARRDASATPPDYGIPCGMNGGSSGGGWVDPATGKVFSVNSYGYSSIKNTMFGPTMGSAAASLLQQAVTNTSQ